MADKIDRGNAGTVWRNFVQECLEFSTTSIQAYTRVGNAWVQGSAELCRGEAQVMSQYWIRVGEATARAMEPVQGAEPGTAMTSDLGMEFGRAYLNAWIQYGEATRSAARKFADLCLADNRS